MARDRGLSDRPSGYRPPSAPPIAPPGTGRPSGSGNAPSGRIHPVGVWCGWISLAVFAVTIVVGIVTGTETSSLEGNLALIGLGFAVVWLMAVNARDGDKG